MSERFQAAVDAHQRGDLSAAERGYREVLALEPGHGAASNNLGLCLATGGRVQEAVDCFRTARACDPRSGDAAVNLAQALQQTGRLDEALAAWREAGALLPQDMEPALAAAVLAADLGLLDDAVRDLVTAADRTPRRDGTRELLMARMGDLAAQCIDTGDLAHGHRLSARLVRLAPHDGTAVHLLEACLRSARIREFDASIMDDLLLYHRSDAVEHHELSRVTCELLSARYPELRQPHDGRAMAAWTAGGVHRDELLIALLVRGRVATAPVERALTVLRVELAQAVHDGVPGDDDWRRFAAALALQCFTNEYVFSTSPREEALAEALGARVAADPRDTDAFTLLACYRAPCDVAGAAVVAGQPADLPGLQGELLRRGVREPLAERALQRQFHPANIGDAISRAVRAQYEASPYPRWQNLERQPPMEVARFLGHEMPHFQPPAALAGAPAILVAGCGTGEHALRVATRHPMCRVTALDLSTASLAYGLRKATELGIGNVTFEHRDILSLDPGEGPFHLIESVGVLHHMHDPAAGLAAIAAVLGAGGVIKLGLYSRRARAGVNRARQRIAALGLEATPDGMRALRQRILEGDEPHLTPLLQSLDFYSMSAVRDLLFHIQEHQFDPPGLRALLERCGLRCIGFQVSPSTRRRYLERFPGDPRMTDLDCWESFETQFPDTFAGMYQFWCARANQ